MSMAGQSRNTAAALSFCLLCLGGCATGGDATRPEMPAVARVRDESVPCRQAPGAAGQQIKQFSATGGASPPSVQAPVAASLERYRLRWSDAIVLEPSGAAVLIVLSRQRGEMHVIDRESGATLRTVLLRDRAGRQLTFAGAIESASRNSLLIRFEEAELWELFLATDAPAVYEGLVHDFRMGEGLREPSMFPVRRISLDAPVIEMMSEPASANLLIVQTDADGNGRLTRLNLDVRRPIAQVNTRSPLAKISLVQERDANWVLLEHPGEIADAYRLPDLLRSDGRQIQSGKCRTP